MRSRKKEVEGPFYLIQGDRCIEIREVHAVDLDAEKPQARTKRGRLRKWPLLRRTRLFGRKRRLL